LPARLSALGVGSPQPSEHDTVTAVTVAAVRLSTGTSFASVMRHLRGIACPELAVFCTGGLSTGVKKPVNL